MKTEFQRQYPSARRVFVTPAAFGIVPSTFTADGAPSRELRLGHFGNLTEEKGLGRAFATLEALFSAGVSARLVLGGVPVTAADQRLLEEGLAIAGSAADYLGDCGRDDVLRRTDVFLFPTRYFNNESYGLVVWEAMLRGIPAAVQRAGCLTSDAIGQGGIVVEPHEDYAAAVVPRLVEWVRNPGAWNEAARRAKYTAEQERRDGHDALERLTTVLSRGPSKPTGP